MNLLIATTSPIQNEGWVIVVLLAPYALGILALIVFTTVHLIPWMKADADWYAYNRAYIEWERTGKQGEMPQHAPRKKPKPNRNGENHS